MGKFSDQRTLLKPLQFNERTGVEIHPDRDGHIRILKPFMPK